MINSSVTAKLIPGVILKPKPRLLIFYIDISFILLVSTCETK